MVLYMDDMLVSSTNGVGIENMKACLARELGMKGEGPITRVLEMEIFRDWNDRKF